MRKILFGLMVFSFILIFAPPASAMQGVANTSIDLEQASPLFVENLCDPDFSAEAIDDSTPYALDYQALERVRIELLERGFNPGFDPERDSEIENQLRQAVAQFQSQYELPVTGQLDTATLAALNVPIEDQFSRLFASQLGGEQPYR